MKFSGIVRSLGVAIFFAGTFLVAAADELAWPQITSENRPWTWWWWHGSAVDEANLARELREFHDAGLGGVQITTIYGTRGAESRDIPYLSPRWLDRLNFTVNEASNLNMGVTMTLGSGWCFGGPTVNNQDANASVVVKTFNLKAGEKFSEKFNRAMTQTLMAFSRDGTVIDLTDKISTDGLVNWAAPSPSPPSGGEGRGEGATWTVYAVSQKPSGQKVKRAAPGGEGWMLNPLYPQAMTNWLSWFDAALKNYSGVKPLAVFQDSYEYRTDWSPDFFAQFEKRRGYKLQNELPSLFGTNLDEQTMRVKYDYRRTVSEIMAGESEPAWIAWAHQNGFQTIYQAHGTPANWLDLYADADMPETEMFRNDRSILISKFASSAAHVAGKKFVGAETGTWLKEHFTGTLADLKYLADDMFLAGVNRIFYHGACYSPADAPWPGWLFYASTEMNPRNPIWRDVPALNNYIARVQSVLQSGQPDNDILLYWPVADFWSAPDGWLQPMAVGKTDWFEKQPIGRVAHELWDRGYAFDYVSDAQLLKAKVADGKIQMPGGKYNGMVVPDCRFMPLETLKTILSLAKDGAQVVFENQMPADVAGWQDLQQRRAEFASLLSEVSSGSLSNCDCATPFGKGKISVGHVGAFLPFDDDGGVGGDSAVHSGGWDGSSGLSFVRRSFGGGWNYFFVNRSGKNFDGWITLDRPVKFAVILDPMTGKSGVAAFGASALNSTEIRLQLAAGESVIVRAFAGEIAGGGEPLARPVAATRRPYPYFQTNGEPTEISGAWNVQFISGGPTLPADLQISKLESWTKFADTNCQSFAGTAKYAVTFDAPNLKSKIRNLKFFLDLGDVRQSARVRLNGKDYGTLIAPPFRVVVDNLQAGGNKLEIEVTSVAANRIRDLDRRGVNWKIFKDINLVNEDYQPFDASNWPLTDCGLLGPVTLTPLRAE